MAEISAPHTKATKEDWLNTARDVLIHDGVEQVKVMPLAARLGVSRSSFYWYFTNRNDLLDALLQGWMATSTENLVAAANMPTANIVEAVCNLYLCFIDPDRFDTRLEFAIHDWSRRSVKVRDLLLSSDARRIEAITDLFARFGYGADDALARARAVYYMQIGYNDRDLREPWERRVNLTPAYLEVFTGQRPTQRQIAAFRSAVQQILARH